jgi:ubiquinol-cytochrome c reductase iron-sulfur subunit
MSSDTREDIDYSRRHFLTIGAGVVGAAGVAAVVTPFVASMEPSRRAAAAGAPVEIDVSKIEPGAIIRVTWRGKPTWCVQRPQTVLKRLPTVDGRLRDPQSKQPQQPSYCQNKYRSIKPHLFVVIGICTHLGCVPDYKPKVGSVSPSWPGGFHCPCHGSKYDLAGRVFQGVPAPLNLQVPDYRFATDTVIRVGEKPTSA